MKLLKHRCHWVFTILAGVCCMILLCSVSVAVQAAQTQVEWIEPIAIELDTLSLDQAPNLIDDNDDYADSVNEAASVLRQQFKDRKSAVMLRVQQDKDTFINTKEYAEKLIFDIYNLAISHTGDPKAGDYISHQFLKMGKWYLTGYYNMVLEKYDLTITCNEVDYFTTDKQEKELDKVVKNLLKELDLDDATDYQKVMGVYDWLCKNVTYDNENLYNSSYMLKHSAYAAIVNKTAVCQGYATAMYRLLLELDVDVRYVGGTGINNAGEAGPHGWNIVKLGGEYYNLDATWDAVYKQANLSYQYFLKNDKEFTGHVRNEESYSFVNTNEYRLGQTSYQNRSFLVTFKNEDGSVLSSDTYSFGERIIPPEDPEKATANGIRYTFKGWDKGVGLCEGEQTFTAVYTQTNVEYTIVFKGWNGEILQSATYSYGQDVQAPEQVSPPDGYAHTGWDSPITKCFGDKVYTAVFTPLVKPGDCNNDGYVNNEDVIYLLWHTLFEEDYPLSCSGDVNGDGYVNNEDVIYLLWHTLFEEDYPLAGCA